tara:strand:- start:611 stop:1732 length:1122 start_codon:yes stop_codon:yes gene_type:complete
MLKKINIFFKKNFEFYKPKRSDCLVIENSNFDEISSILKKRSFELLKFNLSINLYIILKLIIKIKKISQLNYYIEFIKESDPKIILTGIDNNLNFYKLKRFFPDKFFVSCQNGLRNDPMFDKKRNLKSDIIFCNGKSDINFYRSRVKSRIIPIGTIKNNCVNSQVRSIKNCISYISVYRDIKKDEKNINFLGEFNYLTWEEYIESEKKLIRSLFNFCKKNKIKFYIVGCNYDYIKEKKWYEELNESNKINFIPRSGSLSSYEFLKKSKYIVSMDSTLGYEFLSRGSRIIFFSRVVRESKKLSKILNFGSPFNKKSKDFFFTNVINEKEISRLMNTLKRYPKKKWLKKIQKIKEQLMIYDFNNKIFKKEILKIK